MRIHPGATTSTRRGPRELVAGLIVILYVMAMVTAVSVSRARRAEAAPVPAPIMHGYVPLEADKFVQALEGMRSGAGTTLDFTVGITNGASGAVMTYDQWEDGYEADPSNPVQASTLVFGDGNPANGNAATYCSVCTGDLLPPGAALVMRNNISTPRNSSQTRFDGGDKISSSRGFVITAGGFTTGRGSLQAAVVPSFDTTRYGTAFTAPVGTDTPVPSGASNANGYTALLVQAAQAGTVVTVDTNADGVINGADTVATVNEGKSILVTGVKEGATVRSTGPVQVTLATGDPSAQYESRWYPLFQDSVLSDSYLSMASPTVANFRTTNYLYNPGAADITVTPSCASGCTGTITVPAGASAAYTSPAGQAVLFTSAGGAKFIAIGGVGAQSGAYGGSDNSSAWDWGFTLVPSGQLTSQVVLGWAPGNSSNPPSSSAGDLADGPVWVAAMAATDIYVDFDGDPSTGAVADATCQGSHYDQKITVAAYASTKIFDPNDGDMTGARIYTCDGTKLSVAWGEDPSVAPQGAPGFDAGYTVIPFTTTVVDKTAVLATDVGGDGSFSPGDTVLYDISVANGSDSAFTNIKVGDVLPAGVTYVPNSTEHVDGATVTPIADDTAPPAATAFPLDEAGATIPNVASGATAHVRFKVTINSGSSMAGSSITNTGCVTMDGQSSCDDATFTMPVADLELAKSVVTAPAFVGGQGTFRLTLTNKGPDTATGVTVKDLLPAGATYVSSSPSQGTYASSTGVWSVGSLANGATVTLDLTATITATSVTNYAEVTGSGAYDPDSQPGENPLGPQNPPDQDDEATATITTSPQIDLELAKSVTSGPTGAGTTTFQLSLTNKGPSDATGVTVADYLPSGSTGTSGITATGSFDAATGVWTVGTVPANQTVTLSVTTTISSFPATNYAQVTAADQPDVDSTPSTTPLSSTNPPTQDDEASAPVAQAQADLSLTKTLTTVGPIHIGDVVTFEIAVTNGGPADTNNVAVTDLLPANLSYVGSSGPGTYNSGTGLWTVGSLNNGETKTRTILAKVLASGSYTNTAQVVASDLPDPDSTPNNNNPDEDDQDTAQFTATAGSIGDRIWNDLDHDGVQDPGEPGLGSVAVTLYQSEDGGATWSEVDSTTTSPSGAYSFGELTPGDYRVVVTLPTGGYVLSTPDHFDVTLTAGQAYVDADFGMYQQADLSLTKQQTGSPVYLGDTATYSLVLTNHGPADATGVAVTDQLPAGLSYVSDNSGGSYNPVTGVWTVGSVANGATATLQIVATVNTTGTVHNTAEVTASDQFDPDSTPGNNNPDEDDQASADVRVAPVADLSLTKQQTGSPMFLGDHATFLLTLANSGPSEATGVEVTDLLPAGLAYVSSAPSQGTYDSATGVWTVGSVANGGSATLSIEVVVNVTGATNFAQVTKANEHDPDSSPAENPLDADHAPDQDDEASASVQVGEVVDLSLTKTLETAPTYVGDNAVFKITVSNAGPSDATNVKVADLLPAASLQYVSQVASQGSYDAATGEWTVGTIANGDSATLTITAKVLATAATNSAEVSAADQHDVDSTPNNHVSSEDDQDSVVVSALPLVDVSLTKTLSVVPTYVGDLATFEVTASNAGPSPATGVVVTDQLPAGLTYVSDDAAGAYTPSTGVWNVGTLSVGGSKVLHIVVRVDALSAVNTAEVTGTNEHDVDSTPNNHVSTEDDIAAQPVAVQPSADLSLTKTSSPATVVQNDQATFTIKVHNAGPSPATGVEVTDQLPAGVQWVSDSGAGAYNHTTGLWTVGTIPVGADATLTITVKVTGTGAIANVAEVTHSNEHDPDSTPGNNNPAEDDQDTATLSSDPLIDLSLAKIVSAPDANVGSNVTYTVTVHNDGPSAATGVVVTDQLPAGVTYVSHVASAGTYSQATGLWNVGSVAVDGSETLQITVRVTTPGPIQNFSQVTAADQVDVDSQPAENPLDADHGPDQDDEATATVVGKLIDLELGITADKSSVNVGSPVTYTVDLTNQGPSPATGVAVHVTLPPGIDPTAVTPSQGSFDPATSIWTVGDVPVGAALTLTMTATVTGPGPLTVVAEVSAANEPDVDSTPDNHLSSEDDQDAVTVTGLLADLSVTKVVDTAHPKLGETITYTVTVSNAGPSDATGVVISDQLPAALQWVSDSSGGSYDPATGRWVVGNLANGATATLTVTAKVIASGPVSNSAEVAEVDQPDPDSTPGNHNPAEDDQATVESVAVAGSISGVVWLDQDRDAAHDAGEPAIPGVTVLLFDEAGNLAASTTTNTNGEYTFGDLPAGNYTVRIDRSTLPSTIDGQSYDPDDVLDSAHLVSLAAGETVSSIDFGYTPVAPPVTPPPTSRPLPITGFAVGGFLVTGLALVLAGWALVETRRRRERRTA